MSVATVRHEDAQVNGNRLHHARAGALLGSNLDGLKRFVPELTVHRVPDGTHWVIHEQPTEIKRLIREFIGRRP